MAAAPVSLSSAPPARKSMDYAALREDGLRLIRDWASESWTDHNVHDPGITMLEACSYAMTELGLRLQLDVADLLRSGERHAAADLEPAHRVLPVGPVTPQDLRALLLDHPLVSDAQIFLNADNEVPFYELAGTGPPLTFTAGTARVRTGGLYEVLVKLTNRQLNSNTYSLSISTGTGAHAVELALPFWDDIVAAPFRAGATINAIAMVLDGAEFWRALPESQSYFGRLNVTYTGPTGVATIEVWALLFIAEALAQPNAEIPDILTGARTAVESLAGNAPLAQFNTRMRGAARAVDELRSYVAGWRNLGEQAVGIGVVRVQEVAVRARIEVTGGIDVEMLLANLFMDLDEMLSPPVRFESLADRRAVFDSAEQIYDGPLLRRGFLSAESLGATRPAVLYTSDVLRLIMRRRAGSESDLVTQENPVGRDIVAVTDLALSNFINNRPITADGDNCLHLVDISRYQPRVSIAKSRIVLARNDSEVVYDLARVVSLFDKLVHDAAESAVTTDSSPVWPVPRGELLPVEDYTPLQEELPATYGVGRAELPDSAPPERHAAADQLRGYLLVFEQFLGDLTAQVGNVNRFFSIDGDEGVTCFTRPPFDLPGVARLLHSFPANGDWQAFTSDPANPVARALREAAENSERRLDRRNRMLDHRLARLGEDAVALGQELHRWARQELVAGDVPVTSTPESIDARREAANARLVQVKAAFVDDVPELNAFRLMANGNPFHRGAAFMRIEQLGATFRWHLSLQGQELLRANTNSPGSAAAGFAAENAFAFAGRAAHYTVAPADGGQQQLRLMNGTGAAALQIAESTQNFPSVEAANTALAQISVAFAAARMESSKAPMERRVAYLTGIRIPNRRHLLAATNLHFEIFDDPPGGGNFGRRWRLWSGLGNTGQQLLVSPIRFEDPDVNEAIDAARRSIEAMLRFGMDEWNYRVTPPPGNPLTFELVDPSGTQVLARSSAPLASAGAVANAIRAAVELLYRVYGAEGFHFVEHLLLRPRAAGQPFLSLPTSPTTGERDPYSQRVSFVLPSGLARDFSDVSDEPTRTPTAPDRFRDLESRRHVERMIRQSCPAHLMPTVYWVDREAGGAPPDAASFDSFEQRYFAWLDSVLIPGAPAAAVDTARTDLVNSLNAIADHAS